MNRSWLVLSGEYPPQRGGVADYTRALVHGLRSRGHAVTVAAPEHSDHVGRVNHDGVPVLRLPGGFGLRGFRLLDRALREMRNVRPTILLEYVPHAFGMRGANILLPAWLAARREPVWVMFHELAFPIARHQTAAQNALGVVTYGMAAALSARADRTFVSIPAWKGRLPLPRMHAAEWSPIFSTLPTTAPLDAIELWSGRLGGAATVKLGHFGTYGGFITRMLADVLPSVLQNDPRRTIVLLGRGSDTFGETFCREHPALASQVYVAGALAPIDAAAVLANCAAVLQPYPDGISARRTSAIASLALGVPVVTNLGFLSEPLWVDHPGVAAVPWTRNDVGSAVARLTNGSNARARTSEAARALYASTFALERTLDRLEARST